MPQVAVVVIHGIRTADTNYAEKLRRKVVRRLPRDVRARVEWREVFWGDVTHGNQRAYLDRARAANWLMYSTIRWEFVLQGLGDAAAYIRTRTLEGAAYHQIQDRISFVLDQLDAPGLGDRLLVFVGHSLGCQILSSYVWDLNRLKQTPPQPNEDELLEVHAKLATASPFRRLDTLAGIVTLGANIPIFTFAFSPRRVIPITRPRSAGEKAAFPGAALSERQKERARWINFFSPFDILAYPLKPLNVDYNEGIAVERAVWSGGLLFFHPLRAHEGYWTNSTVVHHIVDLLSDLTI